jgi:AbrB family looped-hinge helix DNA binding protein
MNSKHLVEAVPKFYGSVTIGERGQVVIPIEARKELELEPGAKLLVFGGPYPGALMLAPAEAITESLSGIIARLSQLEGLLRSRSELHSPTE